MIIGKQYQGTTRIDGIECDLSEFLEFDQWPGEEELTPWRNMRIRCTNPHHEVNDGNS